MSNEDLHAVFVAKQMIVADGGKDAILAAFPDVEIDDVLIDMMMPLAESNGMIN